MAETPDKPSRWTRLRQHPLSLAIVALLAVAAALVAFLNQLPDLFDKTLPWLGGHVNVGGLSFSVQQALAAVVMAGGLLLLGVIAWQTRASAQRRALDTLLTWVYRRREWSGLSDEGRFTEGAPDFYGQPIYDHLGLMGLYKRAEVVGAEPGFTGQESVGIHDEVSAVVIPGDPERLRESLLEVTQERDDLKKRVAATTPSRFSADEDKRTAIGKVAREAADELNGILHGWSDPGQDTTVVHLYEERVKARALYVKEELLALDLMDVDLAALLSYVPSRPVLTDLAARLGVISQKLIHG
jgi:hypothetical protein